MAKITITLKDTGTDHVGEYTLEDRMIDTLLTEHQVGARMGRQEGESPSAASRFCDEIVHRVVRKVQQAKVKEATKAVPAFSKVERKA